MVHVINRNECKTKRHKFTQIFDKLPFILRSKRAYASSKIIIFFQKKSRPLQQRIRRTRKNSRKLEEVKTSQETWSADVGGVGIS